MFSPVPPESYVRVRIWLIAFCALALLVIAFLTHYSISENSNPSKVVKAERPSLELAKQEKAQFGARE